MPSSPDGRDRFRTVLLFNPAKLFRHKTEGFIPRNALPFSFSSLPLSFQRIEKPVGMVDLFMGVYGLCAFDVHRVGDALNFPVLDRDEDAAFHVAVLAKRLDNTGSHACPLEEICFERPRLFGMPDTGLYRLSRFGRNRIKASFYSRKIKREEKTRIAA
jgi:hypothetical protein